MCVLCVIAIALSRILLCVSACNVRMLTSFLLFADISPPRPLDRAHTLMLEYVTNQLGMMKKTHGMWLLMGNRWNVAFCYRRYSNLWVFFLLYLARCEARNGVWCHVFTPNFTEIVKIFVLVQFWMFFWGVNTLESIQSHESLKIWTKPNELTECCLKCRSIYDN